MLIMDEPTSALSAVEVEVLFKVIRELTAAASRSSTSRTTWTSAWSSRTTQSSCGTAASWHEAPMAEVDLAWIVSKMVGRDESALFSPMAHDPGEPLLEVEDLIVADPDSPERLAVRGVSLTVHAGEVVGVYGLMGAGRTEMLEALAGRNTVLGGTVTLDGRDLTHASVSSGSPPDSCSCRRTGSATGWCRRSRWGATSRWLP